MSYFGITREILLKFNESSQTESLTVLYLFPQKPIQSLCRSAIFFLALIQSVPRGVAVSVLIDEKFSGFMDLPFLWPQKSLLKLNLGR